MENVVILAEIMGDHVLIKSEPKPIKEREENTAENRLLNAIFKDW